MKKFAIVLAKYIGNHGSGRDLLSKENAFLAKQKIKQRQVGQFLLAAKLRMQSDPRWEFPLPPGEHLYLVETRELRKDDFHVFYEIKAPSFVWRQANDSLTYPGKLWQFFE